MKVLECASLLFLVLVKDCHGAPYQPGDKGGKWTDAQAEIIRDKLLYLWANSNRYINRLIEIKYEDKGGKLIETRNSGAQSNYTDYYYDPVIPGVFKNGRLSTVDCINPNESLCRGYWSGKRMSNLQFTEPKAIRLAFHDCIPYKNPNGGSPTGGCDGCINFDEDVVENNVLQPSVALLVSSYLDFNIEHSLYYNFPLYNMYISRRNLLYFRKNYTWRRISPMKDLVVEGV